MNSDLKHPDTLMTRHAVQSLLHHAIHLQGAFCEGVLIGTQGKVEHHQSYDGMPLIPSEQSMQNNIVGLYRSYSDSHAEVCIQDVLETTKKVGLLHVPNLFVAVILSTKGRVENIAFHVQNNQLFPLKLTMQEDGDMQMKALT